MSSTAIARRRFIDRVQASDVLVFLFLLAIARQYVAWLPVSNVIAWSLSVPIAAFGVWPYVRAKSETSGRISIPFWLLVVVPLSFVYLLRAPFPDVSFDVLNYRLFHGIRGLGGLLYRPGDFFPTPAPYNTAPDMVMAITRLLFGYRLGTIINLGALLWAGRIMDDLLRSRIVNGWWRAGAVLIIFGVEHVFFEIDTYMIDLLTLPLLLEAARLTLTRSNTENRRTLFPRIAFLLGLSVAFKLINVVAAFPMVVLCGWRFFLDRPRAGAKETSRVALWSAIVFLLPVLPFTIYLYQVMGSPVFPMMNGIFKSPYWPPNSLWDNRWGPRGACEALIWPVKTFLQPERLSELNVYSGRLSLAFLTAPIAWIFAWRDLQWRRLSFLLLAGLLLWSVATGYIRYALFFELLGGTLVIGMLARAMRQRELWPLAALILCSLGAQSLLACRYTAKTEWSGRPTFFRFPNAWKREAQYFLRDRHSLASFNSADRARFASVDVWIESSIKTASLEILLNRKAPVIGLRSYESFASRESRARFIRAIEQARDKRMFTLCFKEDLNDALLTVAKRGLIAGAQTPLDLGFYSADYRLDLIMIEVSGAEQAATVIGNIP